MADIDGLINALQETTIAREIGIPHDEFRARYALYSNTVDSWRGFENVLADYTMQLYAKCIAPGGRLSRTEALGRAKETIEMVYRRRNGDIVSAYSDVRDGVNSGLRGVLDALADGFKMECVRRYVREQFDSRIENDYETKVDMIRQFMRKFGPQLSGSVQMNRPERYADRLSEIVNAYIEGLRETSAMFRRL